MQKNGDNEAQVVVCECFARDGLQHETSQVATSDKVRIVQGFADAGFRRVEATSYSNPSVVPQFADADAVLAELERVPGVFYKATCANVRAVERALAGAAAGYGANEVSFLVSASESHSQKNLRRSRAAQWENVAEMARLAGNTFRAIGTISVAFGCPFEGAVSEDSVLTDVERFAALGVRHVTLGDTTGMATPVSTRRMFRAVRSMFPEVVPIAHFHDSRGTGLVNYLAALEAGVTWFDTAIGGVGGHPNRVQYGGGFTGNVATEDFVNLLESMGVSTGIDLGALQEVSQACEALLGRPLHSRVARTGFNPLIGDNVPDVSAKLAEESV